MAATSGDMGILANHVPTIEQLNPGVVEVVESAELTKKFFGKETEMLDIGPSFWAVKLTPVYFSFFNSFWWFRHYQPW